MTEDQYCKLCDACDALLLQPGASKARIATGWLHILREHPLLLGKYEMLFARTKWATLRWRVKLLLKRLRYLISYFKSRYRAGRAHGKPFWCSTPVNERPDILFVSHLLNPRQAGVSDDFYFGNLPTSLAADGIKVAVLLINHTSEDGEELTTKWNSDQVPRIVLANTLGSFSEIEIQKQLREESRRLAADMEGGNESHTDPLHTRVRQQASVEALSGTTRTALRQSIQFGLLMDRLKPRVLITTLEGHAWERLAFAAGREAFGETHCIGYIQGTLSRLQHAVRRSLSHAFNPDLILTAGAAAKAQLIGSETIRLIPVEELGSNRWIKPVSIKSRSAKRGAENPACLVVPEGIIEECCCLFLFSLECALAMPSINFIWRLHPLIIFDVLHKAESRFNSLPANIILSSNSIEADISRSQWALYRGSTAIIQCGAAGLRPIYLNLPEELPFDALYELQEWRKEVCRVEEFCGIVQGDLGVDEKATQREAGNAMGYISSIYTHLKPEVLKKIVAARRG